MIFSAGVQHIADFTKPEQIDIDSEHANEFLPEGDNCNIERSLNRIECGDHHELHINLDAHYTLLTALAQVIRKLPFL